MKNQDIFIVHPSSEEQATVLRAFLESLKFRFESLKDENYDPAFKAKIIKARQDYKDGKGKVYTTEQLNDLWK